MKDAGTAKLSMHERLLRKTRLMRRDENPAFIHSRQRQRNNKIASVGRQSMCEYEGTLSVDPTIMSSRGGARNPAAMNTFDGMGSINMS